MPIIVGSKLRVNFPKSGVRGDGSQWLSFNHKESQKDKQSGNYIDLAYFTIFVNNPQQLIHGEYVTVKAITSISVKKTPSKDGSKEYTNYIVNIEIEKNNTYNNSNSNQQNNYDNSSPFGNFNVDDYDLPY